MASLMGISEIILIIFCIAGLVGGFIPIVPSTPLIAAGALIYGLLTDFTILSLHFTIFIISLSLLAEGSEYVLGAASAKKYGASNMGILGAFVGVFLGLVFLGPLGILIGPLLGALAGELLAGKTLEEGLRSAIGAIIGSLGGKLLKILISILMIILIVKDLF